MDVVRDLLDKPVIDRNRRRLGRVDGIVLDRPESGPPRLAAILIGPVALGFRLHPTLGRWMARLERAWDLPSGRPVRIDVGRITTIGRYIKTAVTASDTDALEVERRLRRWVEKMPEVR
jgi:sporulation protein YlmC with PRC-barrel domain